MTQPPPAHDRGPGPHGLASTDRGRLVRAVARSWELFAALVDTLDLDAPTRARGLTARDVVVPLGAWPDNRPLADLLDDARRGTGGVHDQGALVDAVRAAHRHEPDDAVRAAVRRQGRELSGFLAGPDPDGLLEAPVASMLGTLPLVTFLHAATYPLATSALDLETAGATAPDELLENGVVGLADTVGALAARQGLSAGLTAVTPSFSVRTAARDGAWTTEVVGHAAPGPDGTWGPAVLASSRVLLDVAAGRADVPTALARRDLTVHDVPGLLRLAPVVEQVPGIPGRTALVAAIRATQAAGAVWRLLPFGRRDG
ncbi:MAG: hypothetical protein GC157_13480 [Frankiales bacterium]|nr:hypothetical protein [Frankiales bacterium]